MSVQALDGPLPEARGRQWTAADYATRDAAVARFGIAWRAQEMTTLTNGKAIKRGIPVSGREKRMPPLG